MVYASMPMSSYATNGTICYIPQNGQERSKQQCLTNKQTKFTLTIKISGASAGGRRCCELKQNSDEIFTSLLSLNDHYVYNDDGIEYVARD